MTRLGWALSPIVNNIYDWEYAAMMDSCMGGSEFVDSNWYDRQRAKSCRIARNQARARLGMSRSAFNRLMARREISKALDKAVIHKWSE